MNDDSLVHSFDVLYTSWNISDFILLYHKLCFFPFFAYSFTLIYYIMNNDFSVYSFIQLLYYIITSWMLIFSAYSFTFLCYIMNDDFFLTFISFTLLYYIMNDDLFIHIYLPYYITSWMKIFFCTFISFTLLYYIIMIISIIIFLCIFT